jgi:8-oxo-dGTP diphosphatase
LSRIDSRATVHVVAAAVIDAADRVLIAQRPPGKHLAGGWEFPGGKLEVGEERRSGLARELNEELGICIGSPRPLIRIRHAYPSREILLDMWVVRSYSGEPRGLDGQVLRWCSQDELATVELLPADKPIVSALRLPERLTRAETPDYRVAELGIAASDARMLGIYCRDAAEGAAAASVGADFLVMRAAVSAEELQGLCRRVPLPVYARAIDLGLAWALGVSGVHSITL